MPRFLPSSVLLLALAAVAAHPAPPVALPRLQHPGAGQVFYFVLTDRFANGDAANDTGGIPGGRDEHGFDPGAISHYMAATWRGSSTGSVTCRNWA